MYARRQLTGSTHDYFSEHTVTVYTVYCSCFACLYICVRFIFSSLAAGDGNRTRKRKRKTTTNSDRSRESPVLLFMIVVLK